MSRVELAVSRFGEGYNCAQAVLSAFSDALGLDAETALKLAAPFGGGIARTAQTCGAVTGAVMALGLRYGQASTDPEAREQAYRVGEDFLARFRERHGTTGCRELLGHDISTPEGMQAARECGAFKAICPAVVRSAAEILGEML